MFDTEKIIRFEIVTPERVILKDEIRQVIVPTKEGEITVLPKHMPLVASITPGVIELKNKDNETRIMSISGGFVEVLRNKVIILADSAERAEEIDIEKVELARKKAEDSLKDLRQFDKQRYTNIAAAIASELAKSRAVSRWKRISNR